MKIPHHLLPARVTNFLGGTLLACFLCLFSTAAPADSPAWPPAPDHIQLPLWPGTPPDFSPNPIAETAKKGDDLIAGKPLIAVENVSTPTMTVYAPKGRNTGAAVVVFPGGGYQILAIDLEGTEVCDWLTEKGITCVVLKYRVPWSGPHWDSHCKCHLMPKAPWALQDAQRAIGLLRYHAAEWHIDPHKIGVLGFSAGGHLVAATSNLYKKRAYPPIDAADKESARPDFAVALYPGHLWTDEKKFKLTSTLPVTRETPPTFLLQAENDPVDNINHTLVYFIALKNAGVAVEMHVFAQGGHAFGLRRTEKPITAWPQLVETWLKTIGMVAP